MSGVGPGLLCPGRSERGSREETGGAQARTDRRGCGLGRTVSGAASEWRPDWRQNCVSAAERGWVRTASRSGAGRLPPLVERLVLQATSVPTVPGAEKARSYGSSQRFNPCAKQCQECLTSVPGSKSKRKSETPQSWRLGAFLGTIGGHYVEYYTKRT